MVFFLQNSTLIGLNANLLEKIKDPGKNRVGNSIDSFLD